MTHSLFGGSAALVALFASLVVFDTTTSQAVTLQQQQVTNFAPAASTTRPRRTAEQPKSDSEETESIAAPAQTFPAQTFTATAYSLRGRTASGHNVRRGFIAADRRVLPLGTRVRLQAGSQSGEYTVADTGGAVRGRKIDIWVPSTSEAMRFGRRSVKLTVLKYPRSNRAANKKSAGKTRARTVRLQK